MNVRRDIFEEARGRWRGILPRLGIPASALTGKHGPCPLCGGKDRFRFDDRDGDGGYICNQCGAGKGLRLVMLKNGLSFKDAAARVREIIPTAAKTGTAKDRVNSTWLAERIWNEAAPIAGTEAADYLASRNLAGFDSAELRYSSRCVVTDVPGIAMCGAMIARVLNADGSFATVHRTYLQNARKARFIGADGKPQPARKLMPGNLCDGAAIRLLPATSRLGIGEGIETAASASRRFDVPTWAAINSTMLAKFAPSPLIEELLIFGDNDPKFGGQAAAFGLAHKTAVRPASPRVEVHIPQLADSDWNVDGAVE